MESDRCCKVWKILNYYNFEKLRNIPESLKCTKCRKILRNASQVSCGCEFCFSCIEEMLNEGLENCIGDTDDCTNSKLSKYFLDNKTNKEIFKLWFKCPEEHCTTECELIDMVEHLRLCPNRAVKCIFYDFGCDKIKVESKNIQNHYLREQENHYKILLDFIGAVKNEQEERIQSNTEEIKLLKEEIREMNERMMKYENDINQESVALEKDNKSFHSDVAIQTEETVKMFKPRGVGVKWDISISRSSFKKGTFCHGNFLKDMKLPFEVKVRLTNCWDCLQIDLQIPETNINYILWPLKTEITMRIVDANGSLVWGYETKRCEVQRPTNSGHYSIIEPFKFFHFNYFDTIENNEIKLTIECFITVL